VVEVTHGSSGVVFDEIALRGVRRQFARGDLGHSQRPRRDLVARPNTRPRDSPKS